MDYQEILYACEGPTAVITLNRPQALNAWTPTMGRELRQAVAAAEADPAVVGIVITGAGRGFCSGADMAVLAEAAEAGDDADPVDPVTGEMLGSSRFLLRTRKPVIAAINGAVAGMAVPLVLACDLRLVAADAKLTLLFSQRGLVAEWGVSWMLSRLVGPAVALDLLLSSRIVTGEEAHELGLANRVMPAEGVLPAAREYVEMLAERCSPTAMAVIKQQVYADLDRDLVAAEAEACALMVESIKHPDIAEGVTAYREKRSPRFERLGA